MATNGRCWLDSTGPFAPYSRPHRILPGRCPADHQGYLAPAKPGLFHDETVRIRHVRRQRALEDPSDINDVLVVGTAPSVG